MDEKQQARDALIKRAVGYSVSEEAEEYVMVDGVLTLVKRKVSLKDVPPEINAIKMVLSGDETDYSALSEAELEKEKERLIKQLNEKIKTKKIKKGDK